MPPSLSMSITLTHFHPPQHSVDLQMGRQGLVVAIRGRRDDRRPHGGVQQQQLMPRALHAAVATDAQQRPRELGSCALKSRSAANAGCDLGHCVVNVLLTTSNTKHKEAARKPGAMSDPDDRLFDTMPIVRCLGDVSDMNSEDYKFLLFGLRRRKHKSQLLPELRTSILTI
jgi:hypothetical protein